MNDPDAKLRIALAFIVKLLKSQAQQIAGLNSRLAVLAVTVRGLDPTFDDVWKMKEVAVDQTLSAEQQAHIDQYDELLRSIESGELF